MLSRRSSPRATAAALVVLLAASPLAVHAIGNLAIVHYPLCDTSGAPLACETWFTRLADQDRVRDAAWHLDGSLLFVHGKSYGEQGLAALAPDGAVAWATTWSGNTTRYSSEYPVELVVVGERVVVTGHSDGRVDTRAFDARTGALLWNATLDEVTWPRGVAASPDGQRVFTIAQYRHPNATWDTAFFVAAHDAATGAFLWDALYDGPGGGFDEARDVAATDDVVVVAGSSWGAGTHTDAGLVAYDPATGEVLWVQRLNMPHNQDDGAPRLAFTPAGDRLFVAGYTARLDTSSQDDWLLAGLDPVTGDVTWTRTVGGLADVADNVAGLAVAPDGGRLYVTGKVHHTLVTQDDVLTLALDAATGATVWSHLYDSGDVGDNFHRLERAVDVVADATRVAVVMDLESGIWGLNVLDADSGRPTWTARRHMYDHWSAPTAVALSPDGDTIALAGTDNDGDYQYGPESAVVLAFPTTPGGGLS